MRAGTVVGDRRRSAARPLGAGASSATSRYASTSASSEASTRWPALAASPWTVLPRWRFVRLDRARGSCSSGLGQRPLPAAPRWCISLAAPDPPEVTMTYSIVALDQATGELGVAVQTRWFNVGAGVPWVEPGVGAVATQSFTEIAHGSNGLRLMREGLPAGEALGARPRVRPGEATRQVGMVDAAGRGGAHTGSGCVRFASHLVAPGRRRPGEHDGASNRPGGDARGVPADRRATSRSRWSRRCGAAEGEGGDVRGRQSAALVVAPGAGPADPAWRPAAVGPPRRPPGRGPPGAAGRARAAARTSRGLRRDGRGGAGRGPRRRRRGRGGEPSARSRSRTTTTRSAVERGRAGAGGAPGRGAGGVRGRAAVEPRSGEHLRRFTRPGHLPGGDRCSGRSGCAERTRNSDRPPGGWERATGRGSRRRLVFGCSSVGVFGCSSVVSTLRFSGPRALHPSAFDDHIFAPMPGRPAPSTGVGNRTRRMTYRYPATDGDRATPSGSAPGPGPVPASCFGVTPERRRRRSATTPSRLGSAGSRSRRRSPT